VKGGHSTAPEGGNGHAISPMRELPDSAHEDCACACNGPASPEGCRQALKTTWRRSQCPPDASFADNGPGRGAPPGWAWRGNGAGKKIRPVCRAGPGV